MSVVAALLCIVMAQPPTYLDPEATPEARVADLLSRMTLEEKVAQLVSDGSPAVYEPALRTTGLGEISPGPLRGPTAVEAAATYNRLQRLTEDSRLRIPVIVHDEALHGLVGYQATSFPQAIGLAAGFDPDLMGRVAAQIARETKARGIRHVLSPVVNVVRDARWGRVEETYGEDTLLNTEMGVAFVGAFEKMGVLTTPKHYAVNVWDGGRDSHSVQISERQLREVYLPPFEAVVRRAGARTIMASYNSLNGRPASASHWLLTQILRKEWGFQGFVVSDYGSLAGVHFAHRIGANPAEGAAEALKAGMDMELPGRYFYGEPLTQAIQAGLVDMETVDQAVGRVLLAKFQLGLFENRYVDPADAEAVDKDPARHRLALEAARASMVLLTNRDQTLPLSKSAKRVAVLGPLADSLPLGGYSGWGQDVVTVKEGLEKLLGPETQVVSVPSGSMGSGAALPPVPSEALRTPDGQPGLLGEYFANRDLAGAPVLKRVDAKLDFDWVNDAPADGVPADGWSARWTGTLNSPITGELELSLTSDDGVRLYAAGALVHETWSDRAASSDAVTLRVTAGQPVPIMIEYYENAGQSRMSLGWNVSGQGVDTALDQAVTTAQTCDAAVVVVGIREGEGRDRAFLDLPGNQEALIQRVAATGVPTVVVLIAGAPVTMERWVNQPDAILCAWYPGEEGGTAIAETLFGDNNPAGRLPITFPRSVGQCPIYYNLEPSGRGYDYVDLTGRPRFAFGHGLSFTNFDYSNLRVEEGDGGWVIRCDVTNNGKVSGDEVIQLYTSDTSASVVRPLLELKAFRRISLRPDESRTVSFVVTQQALSYLDESLQPILEPGPIEVRVGASAEDIRLRGVLTVRRP